LNDVKLTLKLGKPLMAQCEVPRPHHSVSKKDKTQHKTETHAFCLSHSVVGVALCRVPSSYNF